MSSYQTYKVIEIISDASIEIINEQIAQIREMSKSSNDPDQVARLTEAMARLIDATKR